MAKELNEQEEAQKEFIRQKIGTRIKQLREAAGMTTIELAQKAGISKSNAYAIEAGKYSVGIDVLQRIATALGASIELIDNEY